MRTLRLLMPVLLLLLAGCGEYGNVNQGQVIDYQHDTGVVTLIADSNYRDAARPRFDVLPPVTTRTPENPQEMGPAPEAGKLLRLDTNARKLVIFNSAANQIQEVPYQEMGTAEACAAAPAVDRARKTITLCADHRTLMVSATDELLALPLDTWKAGDEVRYYYKDPARALRFMNITKTNLNKAGE